MKKLVAYIALTLSLIISGCAGADAPKASAPQAGATQQTQAAANANAAQSSEKSAQGTQVAMQVAGKDVKLMLADNATTQRLLAQLPAELSFSDFNHTEKIAYPKEKINVDGAPKGHAPKAGDMCIYVPWGNICIFYHDYKFSSDLVYLGHVEQGLDILSSQTTDFKVKLAVVK